MSKKNVSPLPPTERFIGYEDLHERIYLVREHVYACLSPEELKPDCLFWKEHEQDTALKQATAEVLLAAILWTEAERPPQEILSYAVPEIRKALVYVSNSLIRYLELKQHTQTTAYLNRCSVADAWIHLFVEFYSALANQDLAWIWQLQDLPYVNEDLGYAESPWVSWKGGR